MFFYPKLKKVRFLAISTYEISKKPLFPYLPQNNHFKFILVTFTFTLTLKLFSLSIILTLKNRAFFAFSKRKEILSIIEYELVYCFFIVIFIGLNEEIFNHPNVMKKAQKDIDFVVGKNTQMLKRN